MCAPDAANNGRYPCQPTIGRGYIFHDQEDPIMYKQCSNSYANWDYIQSNIIDVTDNNCQYGTKYNNKCIRYNGRYNSHPNTGNYCYNFRCDPGPYDSYLIGCPGGYIPWINPNYCKSNHYSCNFDGIFLYTLNATDINYMQCNKDLNYLNRCETNDNEVVIMTSCPSNCVIDNSTMPYKCISTPSNRNYICGAYDFHYPNADGRCDLHYRIMNIEYHDYCVPIVYYP
jgi:hypothetical protein